ncbi:MAG: tyrosine--tRNA ligase [Alphaproteobacteria bacterium]|nr:tyrosine--tRNA ligase [Alphaproteobacteria bacterium]
MTVMKMKLNSSFLQTFTERGYLHQCSDLEGLDALAARQPITAYVGYDCTAPSLHVGSLISIMMLRLLQKSGHKPIVLIGGGTTRVGDPTGKDESRPLLTEVQIETNISGIRKVFERFIKFGDGPTDAIMVNNAGWLDRLNYIEFLRDFGTHFTINRMLTMDSVKLRLEREQPLTFLEFNYMLLQAYDFLELNRKYGCHLQMGGSDQWGNIVNGVELGRRADGAHLFGLTTPLLTLSSGKKMGKSESGAVWLNSEMLSPYDYWQYWRNVEDADVGRFLRLFTELPLDEIARLDKLQGQELNDAKKLLATEATLMAHGLDAAQQAAETARRTFEEGAVAEGLPELTIPPADFAPGIAVSELLRRSGLCASGGEARRLIKNRGVRINDQLIENELASLNPADFAGGAVKLSAGKKKHVLVRAGAG